MTRPRRWRARPAADDTLVRSYNDVPYTSHRIPRATLTGSRRSARCSGLDVAPVATCRVLELACGDGANLVPIAATLPAATFVGFDFAAAAHRPRAADGPRASPRQRPCAPSSIYATFRRDFGTFDYIIAHGLYSWVPADVRAHVMPLIARHLRRNGVALVSYNAMPGMPPAARVVWDMAEVPHAQRLDDKSAKVAARARCSDLVATPVDDDTPGQQAMRAREYDSAAQKLRRVASRTTIWASPTSRSIFTSSSTTRAFGH